MEELQIAPLCQNFSLLLYQRLQFAPRGRTLDLSSMGELQFAPLWENFSLLLYGRTLVCSSMGELQFAPLWENCSSLLYGRTLDFILYGRLQFSPLPENTDHQFLYNLRISTHHLSHSSTSAILGQRTKAKNI